jgi:hypothetical protein
MGNDVLTIAEAALLLGRSTQYVWLHLVDGTIPHLTEPSKRGGRWTMRLSDVLAYRGPGLPETRGRKPTARATLSKKMSKILEGATA